MPINGGTFTGNVSMGTNAMYLGPSARIYGDASQSLYLRASGESNFGLHVGVTSSTWAIRPVVDNNTALGLSSHRWTNVYAATGTIITSDRAKKTNISDIEDSAAKDFIMSLNPVTYKLIDGESGRTHWGLISQDIEENTLATCNLTDMDFAGFIKSPKVEIIETEDENRNKTTQSKTIEGKYEYGLRYEEFISPLIKMVQYQQKKIEELERKLTT